MRTYSVIFRGRTENFRTKKSALEYAKYNCRPNRAEGAPHIKVYVDMKWVGNINMQGEPIYPFIGR